MSATAILLLLIQNAPSIITTVEGLITWAEKAWTSTKAAYDQPANTITKEQLLAHLDVIKAQSAEIQALR